MLGAGIWLVDRLWHLVPGWLGLPPYQPLTGTTESLLGLRWQLSIFLKGCQEAPMIPLAILLVLLLLYVVLRRKWPAAFVTWLLLTLYVSLQHDSLAVDFLFLGFAAALFLFGLMRFGLLTAVFTNLAFQLCASSAMTPDFNAWYAGGTLITVTTLVGLAAGGFYTSLGGQPLMSGGLLDKTESGN